MLQGSISISMTLHQTTFCFVCTHLTSGEKEGDEVRRNSDVMEILKRTRFSHSCRASGQSVPPDSILDHEWVLLPISFLKFSFICFNVFNVWSWSYLGTLLSFSKVIWLGDLNYRLAAGSGDTHELLNNHDWQALLEKDQVRNLNKLFKVTSMYFSLRMKVYYFSISLVSKDYILYCSWG